jgi:hypothetical protein
VLKWAAERYQPRAAPLTAEAAPTPSLLPPLSTQSFLSVHQLFDAASPESGIQKVLAVAYWFQVIQGEVEWDSQTINTELKQMGHPSSNITRDLDVLMSRTPRMVMQVRKQGTTKQARKLYTLTREGIKVVEEQLSKGR